MAGRLLDKTGGPQDGALSSTGQLNPSADTHYHGNHSIFFKEQLPIAKPKKKREIKPKTQPQRKTKWQI